MGQQGRKRCAKDPSRMLWAASVTNNGDNESNAHSSISRDSRSRSFVQRSDSVVWYDGSGTVSSVIVAEADEGRFTSQQYAGTD